MERGLDPLLRAIPRKRNKAPILARRRAFPIVLLPLLLTAGVAAAQPTPAPAADSRADPAAEAAGSASEEAAGAPPDSEADEEPDAPPAPTIPSAGVEEIVITGEILDTTLQDEAVSAVEFTPEELRAQRIVDLRDLSGYSPNLEVKSAFAASNPQLFLRGVGINDLNSNAASAVAVYNDGVYMNSPLGQLAQMYDLESVEVLRGPQGSLYGRNASAGAILVNAQKPTQEFDAYSTVTYGKYNLLEVSGAAGAGILSDLLSGRAAFRLAQADGVTENRCRGDAACSTDGLDDPTNPGIAGDVNNIDNWAARGMLRLTPDRAEMDWLAIAHGSRNQGLATQFQHTGARIPPGQALPCDPTVGRTNSAGVPLGLPCTDVSNYFDPDGDPYAGAYEFGGNEQLANWGTSVTGRWSLGEFRFQSISAYESADRKVEQHIDAAPNDLIRGVLDDNVWQASQELWVSWDAPGGLLRTTGGGYFFTETLDSDNLYNSLTNRTFPVALGGPFTHQVFQQGTYSFALFEHVEWEPSDLYLLEGGIRFNWEQKDFDIGATVGREGGPQPETLNASEVKAWNGISGDISISYRPTEDVSIYAKYARGWKAGAWNGGAIEQVSLAEPVKPESVDAYEIGFKSSWLDELLTLNLSAFYYDYDNLQVFNLERAAGAVPVQQLINANDAEVYGVELELFASPLDHLLDFPGPQLRLNWGWLESQYNNFIDTFQKTIPRRGPLDRPRPVEFLTDYTGNRLVGSPRFSASGWIEWSLPLFGGHDPSWGWIVPRYDFTFKDEVFFDPAEGRGILQSFRSNIIGQDAYALHNFQLAYRDPTQSFEIAAWLRNAFDQQYKVDAFDLSEGYGLIVSAMGEPRTFGVTGTVYLSRLSEQLGDGRWSAAAPLAAIPALVADLARSAASSLPSASGEGWTEAQGPRWIPSFKLGADLLSTQGSGSIANTIRNPSAEISTNADCPDVCVLSGEQAIQGPVLSMGLELAGPPLGAPGRPRPFIHAGYQHWTIPTTDIAREGDPEGGFRFPGTFNPAIIEPQDILGQGTLLQYDAEGSWWAGIGLSWQAPFEVLEHPVWFKPSIDYFGMAGSVRGRVKHVTGMRGDSGNFSYIDVASSTSTSYHGLGPRFTVDTAIARLGPVGLNLYFDTMFYWLLTDRDTSFRASFPEGEMAADFEMGQLVAQGGAGLRLSWFGWPGE